MFVKWLQSLSRTNKVDSFDDEITERVAMPADGELLDVAHEAMREDMADLEGLIKSGWPTVQRQKFKKDVRKKVWSIVSKGYCDGAGDEVSEDMVEDITERIVDVAENDQRYREMFGK